MPPIFADMLKLWIDFCFKYLFSINIIQEW